MATKTDHIVPDFLLSPQKRVYRHLLLQLIVFFITINVFWDTPDELIITPPRIRSWIGYFLMIDMLIYVNAYVVVPAQRAVSPLPAQFNDPDLVMYHHTRDTSNPFRRYPVRKHSTQSIGDVAEYHFFDSLLRITGCRLIRARPF